MPTSCSYSQRVPCCHLEEGVCHGSSLHLDVPWIALLPANPDARVTVPQPDSHADSSRHSQERRLCLHGFSMCRIGTSSGLGNPKACRDVAESRRSAYGEARPGSQQRNEIHTECDIGPTSVIRPGRAIPHKTPADSGLRSIAAYNPRSKPARAPRRVGPWPDASSGHIVIGSRSFARVDPSAGRGLWDRGGQTRKP